MTVLNTIELTEIHPAVVGIFIGCLSVCVISFISAFFIPTKYEHVGVICIAMSVIALLGVFVCGSLFDNVTVPNGKVQHEVLISDDTSFAEVIEKYDIIEQRGEIFVVEEKE